MPTAAPISSIVTSWKPRPRISRMASVRRASRLDAIAIPTGPAAASPTGACTGGSSVQATVIAADMRIASMRLRGSDARCVVIEPMTLSNDPLRYLASVLSRPATVGLLSVSSGRILPSGVAKRVCMRPTISPNACRSG